MKTQKTPADMLRRVLKISRANGWSIAVVAGIGALATFALGDWLGTGIGLLAVVSGVMEVHGSRRLQHRDPGGMAWLVRAELFLLSVILVYAVSRLASFDSETALANLTPDMEAALRDAGIGRDEIVPLVRLAFRIFYGTVIFVGCLYQGGLAWYYRRKTPDVLRALAGLPPAA